MGADLVGAHYPLNFGLDSLYGQARNASQANVPIRSNLEYLGIGGGLTDTAGATAIAASAVMGVVPIPVDAGTTISKISMLVGATAASYYPGDGGISFAALYQGSGASPALIGQSTAAASVAFTASTRADFTLTTPYTIGSNANDAPYGYVFAAIMIKATTLPTVITNAGTIAAAAQYGWFTNSPGYGTWSASSKGQLAFTAGSALTTTAPATLIWVANHTVAPLVFLS